MNNILDLYPKTRTVLPKAYQEIYVQHYKINREGESSATSLAQKMERWLHKKVAKDLVSKDQSTLEIGGGTLNQLDYEQTQPYDVIEPFKELYIKTKNKEKVRRFYKDIDEIDINSHYNRITSIATFEHITDLPKVVAKTCFLLDEKGTLRIAIPNEGTFLWKLGYKLTTGIEFKIKYGLDYEILMKHEHVNTAREIEDVLDVFYDKIESANFGLNKGFAFYRYFECSRPKKSVAKEYLTSIQKS